MSTIGECARLTLLTRGEVDEMAAYAVAHQTLAETMLHNRKDKVIAPIERSLKILRREIDANNYQRGM